MNCGEVVILRESQPDGTHRVRITRADKVVRISWELLGLIESGETLPTLRLEGGLVHVVDDYGQAYSYKLGNADEPNEAQWMTMVTGSGRALVQQ